MASETTVGVWIYYKDEEDWFHGPYMKHEVLDRYRNKRELLKDSFPFYVLTGDERPNIETKSRTLGELIAAIKSPFSLHAMGNATTAVIVETQSEENSVDQTGEEDYEGDIEDGEEEEEDFEEEKGEEEKGSEKEEENGEAKESKEDDIVKENSRENARHDELAKAWAAYYLDVLEAYKTGKWDKVDGEKAKEIIKSMGRALESESLRDKCRKELEKRLKELDYVYCSECKTILHNYKQMVMHVTINHINEKKADLLEDLEKKADLLDNLKTNVNVIMEQIYNPSLQNWKEEEAKYIKEVRDKHPNYDRASLRPEQAFLQTFKQHSSTVYDRVDNAGAPFEKVLAKMIPRLKRDEASRAMGLNIFNQLDEHIADNVTHCYNCSVITGNREDYYKHLCTFAHIKNAGGKDLITLIVNLYKTPERAKLVNELTTYYLDVLEAYKTRKLDKVTVDRYRHITRSMQKQDFTEGDLRETIYDVLKFRLTQLDTHFYCSECGSIFHNYKQILMHAMVKHKGSDTPLKLLDDVNDAIKRICKPQLEKMHTAEVTLLDEMDEKYSDGNPAALVLSPTPEFIKRIEQKYSHAIYRCDAEQLGDSNFASIVAEMIPRLKKDFRLVNKIMNELCTHLIGLHRRTRCIECNVVTGDREGYFKHLRTNGHLKNAKGKDIITLVVNMHKYKK